MTAQELQAAAQAFLDNAPENRLTADRALRPELEGLRYYEDAIFGFASAQDDYLKRLHTESGAGLVMPAPSTWLASAQTVVAFFLPFSARVRESNRGDETPSYEWLHARIEGQACMEAISRHLCGALKSAGYEAVTPTQHPDFWADTQRAYTSNWSERHVAYACGLGTFCLSKGLITEKGVAGRFGSLITSLALAPTGRAYTALESNCTRCGACVRNCPANAISMETGKDHRRCADWVGAMHQTFKPYYGCGKCQVGTPCEARNPQRHAQTV